MGSYTNQGQDFSTVLEDVDYSDLNAAAAIMWKESRRHPDHATCDCPGIEFLAALYARGYRMVKREQE